MIKAIIFDLFATLSHGGPNPEKDLITKFNLKQDYSFVEKCVCGTKFSNMDSYLDKIIEVLELSIEPWQLKDLFEKDIAKDKINQEMISLVEQIKIKNIKLGIISNIPNPLYDLIRQNNLQAMFDEIVYSYDFGITKPDHRLFEIMVSKLGVKPSEVVVVGDSLNNDINPAKELGMKTIHFKSVQQLKKELEIYGVII